FASTLINIWFFQETPPGLLPENIGSWIQQIRRSYIFVWNASLSLRCFPLLYFNKCLPMPRVYFRKKHGRGFRYVDGQGKTVRDEKLKGWFKSLVIPPAWTEVEISGMKSANLLVTGRDDKGRKQYIYHPDFVRKQNQKKFERLVSFGEKLHHLREVVPSHLRKRGNSREKVLAAMVRLMDETYMR